MEHFYTLQGEGFHTGTAAYFIRLGGCDVGCVWCDVKESWDAAAHPQVSVAEMLGYVTGAKAKMAVITGGEPAMHDLTGLINGLKAENIKVHIETSGAHQLVGNPDWITLSPKKFKSPLDTMLLLADELKVVIYNTSDFEWAEIHAGKVKTDCALYLQPEWSRAEKINPAIIDYIRENPKCRLSLQTHKYINIA